MSEANKKMKSSVTTLSPSRSQVGEPIEVIYYDQYTPDGISRLVKKEIYTYYPVGVFSKEE